MTRNTHTPHNMRLSTLLATLLPLLASFAYAATICNSDSSLCDKLYSNVTFIGAHDSYAVGSSIADNQDKDVTSQLNEGVRALQIQTHNASDGIHVCHTSCSLVDGGTLESYLAKVASWISSNPNDVITLVMVNIDDLPPTAFTSAFTASNLSNHTYSPPSATVSLFSWPTMGTLVDAGTTLVVFMDQEADFSSVPYIIDEFSNMWEDTYGGSSDGASGHDSRVMGMVDVTTSDWSCATNRSSGNPGSTMMLVNHFLDSVRRQLSGVNLMLMGVGRHIASVARSFSYPTKRTSIPLTPRAASPSTSATANPSGGTSLSPLPSPLSPPLSSPLSPLFSTCLLIPHQAQPKHHPDGLLRLER